LGAVVLIMSDTGSASGFVVFREPFTFRVRGPWGIAYMRREEWGKDPREEEKTYDRIRVTCLAE